MNFVEMFMGFVDAFVWFGVVMLKENDSVDLIPFFGL